MSTERLKDPTLVDEHYAEALDHVLNFAAGEPEKFGYMDLAARWREHGIDPPPPAEGGLTLFAEMRDDVSAALIAAGIEHEWVIGREPGGSVFKVFGLRFAQEVVVEDLPSPGQYYLGADEPVEDTVMVPQPISGVDTDTVVPGAESGLHPSLSMQSVEGSGFNHELLRLLFAGRVEGLVRIRDVKKALVEMGISPQDAAAAISAAREAGILHRHVIGGNVYLGLTPATQTVKAQEAEPQERLRTVTETEVDVMSLVLDAVYKSPAYGESSAVRRSQVMRMLHLRGVQSDLAQRAIRILINAGYLVQNANTRRQGHRPTLTYGSLERVRQWRDDRDVLLQQLAALQVKLQ